MCKIAACVLTYNHPEVIEDVLNKSIDDYYESGIDIYYYDSSENEDTKTVIRSYQEKGYDNLYYVKIDSSKTSSEKLMIVLKGKYLKKEYDYIWPLKDRSYCPKETLEKIIIEAKEGHNIIFLGVLGNRYGIEKKIYNSAQEFYANWGWLATSWDVVIYKKKTILTDLDNCNFTEIYEYEYNRPWFGYITLFFKLAELQNPDISLWGGSKVKINNSNLAKSGWEKEIFEIWKDSWIKVNDNLPKCYEEYKDHIIKKGASLPWILGSISKLIELHKKGILTAENYKNVQRDWERVSDIPLHIVEQIANGTYDPYHDVSGIKNINSEIAALLIQCTNLLREKRISKEQIPFDDIVVCMHSELKNRNKYSEDRLYSVFGTIEDVKQYIMKDNINEEDVAKAMQMLINLLLLSE